MQSERIGMPSLGITGEYRLDNTESGGDENRHRRSELQVRDLAGNCLAFHTLLVVGNTPTPLKRTRAAVHDPLAEDIRDLVTIASKKGFRCAHLST